MGQQATAPRAAELSEPWPPDGTADWPRHPLGKAPPESSTMSLAAEPASDGPLAVSVIAHEFRAPLASLAAASELLLEDLNVLDPRQMRDMLTTIRDGTLWLQGMVENLLCAASIQAGRFRIHVEPLNLLDVVMEIQPLVAPLLLQKGQAMKLAAGRNLPLVLADRRWIGQALVNLIANASKYSAVNTPVSVRLAERDGCLRATVADRGPGLPVGGETRLFEPFYRGDGAEAVDRGGVGLGLAIVKSVVEAHGGRVGAENRAKGGACLWLELAAAPGTGPAGLETAHASHVTGEVFR